MSAYWLGVLTTPALAILLFGAFVAYVRAMTALDQLGFTFEVKWKRATERISDYTLRHDIWWERSFGPVFVGGWYFERSRWTQVNRWIGIGRAGGPCWMAFRSRVLTRVTSPAEGRA